MSSEFDSELLKVLQIIVAIGVVSIITYFMVTIIFSGKKKDVLPFIFYLASFSLGVFILSLAVGTGDSPTHAVSCIGSEPIQYCNGWPLFFSFGSTLKGALLTIGGNSSSHAAIISMVTLFVVYMTLAQNAFKPSGTFVLEAFVAGAITYLVLANTGWVLAQVSQLFGGIVNNQGANSEQLKATIQGYATAYDNMSEAWSQRSLLETVRNIIGDIMFTISFVAIYVFLSYLSFQNFLFAALQTFMLLFLPYISLFLLLIGSFSVFTAFRIIVYITLINALMILQSFCLQMLPQVDPAIGGSLGIVDALGVMGTTVGCLVVVAAVGATGLVKIVLTIYAREILPLQKAYKFLKTGK